MHPLRVVPVVVLALALGSLTAGCGSDGATDTGKSAVETTVSAADQACRDRWHALGSDLADKAGRGVMVRRAFQSRWESIGAGIGYYESTANADQCGQLLVTQREAIRDLDALVTKALPYDLEQRAASATAARAKWRTAHPGKQEPKPVRRAYRTLKAKVARASSDLSPAITELATTDPGRAKAVSRGVQDLGLLAETSDAFVACYQALAQVRAFVHPAKKKPKKKP